VIDREIPGVNKVSDLVPVDLYKQRQDIEKYVEGWPTNRILDWMGKFGTIVEPKVNSLPLYIFRSHSGIESHFYFGENQQIVIVSSGWLP
jgi:hypothetical protein